MLTPPNKVGIVGAGIGGLTLAIALKKRGIGYHIYEAAPAPAEGGAGITLAPNALSLLEDAGLKRALSQAGEIQQIGRILWQDGSPLSEIRLPAPLLAFHRAELIRLLTEEAGRNCISYGIRVSAVAPDGIIVNDQGSHQFDFVAVADGLRSQLRKPIGERIPRFSGQISWRGVAPIKTGEGAEIWGDKPGLRFGYVPLKGDRTYFYATALGVAGQASLQTEESIQEVRELFRDFPSVVSDLLEATDRLIYTDIYDLKPEHNWQSGRLAYLGDCVHATTPNLGQGACQAIESAFALANHIGQPNGLQKYEASRYAKAKFVTKASWRINGLLNLKGAPGRWLRKNIFRLLPESAQKRNFEILFRN